MHNNQLAIGNWEKTSCGCCSFVHTSQPEVIYVKDNVEFYITLCQHLSLVLPVVDHPIKEDAMNASFNEHVNYERTIPAVW